MTIHVAGDTSAPQLSLTLPPNGNPPWNTTLPAIQLDAATPAGWRRSSASRTRRCSRSRSSPRQYDPQRAAPSVDRRDPADLVHGDRQRRQPDDRQRLHPHRHDGAALTPTVSPNPVVLNGTATASANARRDVRRRLTDCDLSSRAPSALSPSRAPRPTSPGTRAPRPQPTTWCLRRASASANRAARYCSR